MVDIWCWVNSEVFSNILNHQIAQLNILVWFSEGIFSYLVKYSVYLGKIALLHDYTELMRVGASSRNELFEWSSTTAAFVANGSTSWQKCEDPKQGSQRNQPNTTFGELHLSEATDIQCSTFCAMLPAQYAQYWKRGAVIMSRGKTNYSDQIIVKFNKWHIYK